MAKHISLLLWLCAIACISHAFGAEDKFEEWEVLDKQLGEDQNDHSALESPQQVPRAQQLRDGTVPWLVGGFLVSSLLVALIGGRGNAKLTLAFEEQFCQEPEGFLWKQFTRLGRGKGKLLLSDGASIFKLHANGHRHLAGAVMTLRLLRRHEMISYLGQRLAQQEDVMCIELFVKDNLMPPMVLAIATTSAHKELVRNHQELKQLATKMEVSEDKIKSWPRGDLVVYAEHPSYFYDMMTRPMLAQCILESYQQVVFMESWRLRCLQEQIFTLSAFQHQKQYFRGLQVTSESDTSHKKVIRCWVKLPAAEKMDELTPLVMASFALLNQVATYSISAERQRDAEQARQEIAKQLKSNKATSKDLTASIRAKAKRR